MPEDHRRVEPRFIVGTGMATGPERLAQIEHDAARMQRAWRDAPEERFGDVLGRAPARGDMVDADVPDRRRPATLAAEAEAEAAPPSSTTSQQSRPTRLSPRAPDPREQQLRNTLAAQQPRSSTATTTTPAKR